MHGDQNRSVRLKEEDNTAAVLRWHGTILQEGISRPVLYLQKKKSWSGDPRQDFPFFIKSIFYISEYIVRSKRLERRELCFFFQYLNFPLLVLKKNFKDVSREFDEFRANTHLCKQLRCWHLLVIYYVGEFFHNGRGHIVLLKKQTRIYTSIYIYYKKLLVHWSTKRKFLPCLLFYKNISRHVSRVSATNFGSLFIFAPCVVGTCNILCGCVFL